MGCQPCDDCVSMLRLENDDLIFRLDEVDILAHLSAELQDTDTLNLEQVLLNVNELWSLYNMTADALLYILSDFYGFQVDNTILYTNFNIFNEMVCLFMYVILSVCLSVCLTVSPKSAEFLDSTDLGFVGHCSTY